MAVASAGGDQPQHLQLARRQRAVASPRRAGPRRARSGAARRAPRTRPAPRPGRAGRCPRRRERGTPARPAGASAPPRTARQRAARSAGRRGAAAARPRGRPPPARPRRGPGPRSPRGPGSSSARRSRRELVAGLPRVGDGAAGQRPISARAGSSFARSSGSAVSPSAPAHGAHRRLGVALRQPQQREARLRLPASGAGVAVGGLGRRRVAAQPVDLGLAVQRLAPRPCGPSSARTARAPAPPRRAPAPRRRGPA